MIYINNSTDEITIPANLKRITNNYTLELVNNISNVKYTLSGLTDMSVSDLYYRFINLNGQIVTAKFVTGEYTYYLFAGDRFLEMGLCRYGDFDTNPTEYTLNNNTAIIYEK